MVSIILMTWVRWVMSDFKSPSVAAVMPSSYAVHATTEKHALATVILHSVTLGQILGGRKCLGDGLDDRELRIFIYIKS